MYIEKLKSGSYRITQTIDGKRNRVTLPYRPTNAEAVRIMADKLNTAVTGEKTVFTDACAEYARQKENVLSPRTIREYTLLPKRLPEWFVKLRLYQIDNKQIQKMVNELAKRLAPKTVRDYHAFVSTVVRYFIPSICINTTLPQKVKKEPYIPTDDDIKRLLDYSKERSPKYYIPIYLACFSLRRSEICALTVKDLDKNDYLHISKALVQAKDGDWVKKSTKTTASTRLVPLSHDIAELIRKQGYVYNGTPQALYRAMHKMQLELGMQPFSLHKCRHYFASTMATMGYATKDILLVGGWETDTVMKTVYQHAQRLKNEDEMKQLASRLNEQIGQAKPTK